MNRQFLEWSIFFENSNELKLAQNTIVLLQLEVGTLGIWFICGKSQFICYAKMLSPILTIGPNCQWIFAYWYIA